MLEKIGTRYYEKLSCPNQVFLEYIEQLKSTLPQMVIAEIGIGIGATVQAALRVLRNNDRYYLFDYSDKVEELCQELNCAHSDTPQIINLGNSRSMFDNYVWSLYRLSADKRQNNEALFDLVLLDGAHDYTVDLAACALITDLLKPNGFLIVDDISLNLKTIMKHNPLKINELKGLYSEAQMSAFQMQMICESFLDRRPDLQRILTKDHTLAVYCKK